MIDKLLQTLRGMPNTWKRRLFFVAILTKALERDGLKPVVVGGHAVEFYTLGDYATKDIDIVMDESRRLDDLLNAWGFMRQGRHWYHEEFDIAIEVPSTTLAGDMERLVEVEVEGLPVYLIGIEDIIIDRINALVHWKSIRDGEWAHEMLCLHAGEIDREYLLRRAGEEGTMDALQTLLKRDEP